MKNGVDNVIVNYTEFSVGNKNKNITTTLQI